MRGDDTDAAAGLGNAMEFTHEAQHIGHVFDHVATNDLIKFVIRKRIGSDAEIVNHIGLRTRVGVDPNSAGVLILSAANVKNLEGGDCR